jgi:hypothetical protein
MAKELE